MITEYPAWLIKAVLGFWPQLDAIKYRATAPALQPDSRILHPESDFWDQEGHTMLSKVPQTTRIAHNSHAKSEELSTIMVDISHAINQTLSVEEAYAVRIFCMLWADLEDEEIGLPDITRTLAHGALRKLYAFLNNVPCRN